MKLSKERISHLAESLASRLQEQGYLELLGTKKSLTDALDRVITDELSVEDRLNAEVRQLMKQYEAEIERGGADYQKMFMMIKNKLAKERGLIL
ncbi:MAG: DUF507 domain-containing protein [Nitrospiraceae bacterium]